MVLLLCLLTNALARTGRAIAGPYVLIWTVGFSTWAAIFWWLRHRGGPVTFVERQIAHVWGASIDRLFVAVCDRNAAWACRY